LSICLFLQSILLLFMILSFRLWVCMSHWLFVFLSLCLYVSLSRCLSVSLSIYLSICLSFCLSVSIICFFCIMFGVKFNLIFRLNVSYFFYFLSICWSPRVPLSSLFVSVSLILTFSLSSPLPQHLSPFPLSLFIVLLSLMYKLTLLPFLCLYMFLPSLSFSHVFSSLSLSLSPLSLLSLSLSHFTRRDLSNVKPSYKQFVSNHVCLCNFEKKLFSWKT